MSNRQLVYIKDDEIINMVSETLEKQLKPLSDEIIERLTENNKLNIKEFREFFIEEINKQKEFYSKATRELVDEIYSRIEKNILEQLAETNRNIDNMISNTGKLIEMMECEKSKTRVNSVSLVNKIRNTKLLTRGRRGKKLQGQLNK